MAEEEKKQETQETEEKEQSQEAPKEESQKEEPSKEKEAPKEEKVEDKAEEEVEVPDKFKDLVEKIEQLSVLDLAELVKILEKKFGVSAAAPAAVVSASAGSGDESGGGEEKSEFNVELQEIGDKKIEVIKVARDALGKGLKEAKDLIDGAASGPKVIKEGAKKEEAEELKKKFEAAGAKVELK
jgi:large subunit ribosomal protein L7/L12